MPNQGCPAGEPDNSQKRLFFFFSDLRTPLQGQGLTTPGFSKMSEAGGTQRQRRWVSIKLVSQGLSVKPCHSLSTSSSLGERLEVDFVLVMRHRTARFPLMTFPRSFGTRHPNDGYKFIQKLIFSSCHGALVSFCHGS